MTLTEAEPRVDPRQWAARPSGVSRILPIAGWLPRYDRRFLRMDVIAGATVWGLLVPESIAYAGLAGLPPQAGLYALLATLAAYAVFGTSRHLIAGPTSAAAVLLASSVGDLASPAPPSTPPTRRRSCCSAAACSSSRGCCGSASSPSSSRAR